MKQIAFVTEFFSDGEKTIYVVRLTNGQALFCVDDIGVFHKKIDSLFEDFNKSPEKE